MANRSGGRGLWPRRSWFGLLAAAPALVLPPSARAQNPFEIAPPASNASSKVYFDSSHTADALLRNAENHARTGDFAEALAIYQRVADQFGDKVVEVSTEGRPGGGDEASRLLINARRECQRRIALMPDEARVLYRNRVDPQARLWLDRGRDARDRASLRKVVDQAFCSSWGDDALDLLGDLAFQEGRFAEALEAFDQLLPARPGAVPGLVHPDVSVDLGRVAAKKLLCRAAIGEDAPRTAELAAFAKDNAGAATPFAGRRGNLARDLIEAIRDDHLEPPKQSDGRWPTFAGSAARDRVAPGPVDVGSMQWKVPLEPIALPKTMAIRSRGGFGAITTSASSSVSSPERLLAYHPVVVGDQVIVAGDRQVMAYDLNRRPGELSSAAVQGAPEPVWKTLELMPSLVAGRISGSLPRYTLTTHGSRIYAQVGPPASSGVSMNRLNMNSTAPSNSVIVALDRAADGKMLWEVNAAKIPLPRRPGSSGSASAVFEGAPVADGQSVYVGLTDRVEMTSTHVVCLDAANGEVRWVRYVCEANAGNAVDFGFPIGMEVSQRLLSLHGNTLYYQTNLGAVASIETEGGAIRWLATYPWTARNGINNGFSGMGGGPATRTGRDLNPAVVHDGLVIVAPDDASSLFAFEAATGHLAWKSDPIPEDSRLTHVLGVAKGHVIATGDRVLWFDARTGKLAHAWPEQAQAVQGYGRGLLAGDRIYWPTQNEIHVLDQATGLRTEPPIKLNEVYDCKGGNLAVGDGYLIVAGADSLVVFCQNSRLIERYRDEIARNPKDALNYFRLARVAEAVDRLEMALENLDVALPLIRPSESVDGVPLIEAARDHRRRLLSKLGARAKLARDWPEAIRRYDAASQAAPNDRERLASRLELADVRVLAGDHRGAVGTWQALLADERLRSLSVDAADGHRTVRADLLIVDRLDALLRDRGRELYAEYDRAAAELFDRGMERQDPRLLEDVGRAYPSASVVARSWLAVGEIYEKAGRPRDAARAFKRLAASDRGDESDRARAGWGLARSFEDQKLWGAAREAYRDLAARHPDLRVEGIGSEPLGLMVDERLGRLPTGPSADGAEPSLAVPLRRRWDRPGEGGRLIVAASPPPSAESPRAFLAAGTAISPVDPSTGRLAWSRDLGGEPAWVDYLADRVVAATATRVVALGLESGAVEWQYDLVDAVDPAKVGGLRKEAKAGQVAPRPAALSDFRIVGGRIFCLKGDRALLSLDGETGLLDWSFAPTSGTINPRLLIGPARIVLQVRQPNALLVLDTLSGQGRGEFARPDDEAWQRDPLAIDDDHVAVVADRTRVALLDLDRGVYSWVFQETTALPNTGPPRLIGDDGRLFVLHDGRDLIRIDPSTGRKRWSRPLGTEDLSERPEALAIGADRAFVADGGSLTAIDLADGSPAWRKTLAGPFARWSVLLSDRSVVAYPVLAATVDGEGADLSLLFRRRKDGELIQRIQLPAPTSSSLAVQLSDQGVLVASGGGLWSLGDRKSMDEGGRGR